MGNNGAVERRMLTFEVDGVEHRLTHAERVFAMAYIQNGWNATKATITAGYSERTAGSIGAELLCRPRIRGFIRAVQDNVAYQLGINAIDIAREYAKVGFSDVRKIYDENGCVVKANDFDDNTAAAVASIEQTEVFERGKYVGKNIKVKFYDKVVALDKLARMIGVDAKSQIAEAKKPEPLQIEIKHSPAKIKKSGDDGTIPGNTEV